MAYMKSPFNFIEISDKIYNPDWSMIYHFLMV